MLSFIKKFFQKKNNGWFLVTFDVGKPTICPEVLADDLIADMLARECTNPMTTEIDGGFLDWPNIFDIQQSWETLRMGRLELNVPSSAVETFLISLRDCHRRVFVSGKQYFKLHGFTTCIVLDPVQRDELERLLERALPQALVATKKEKEAIREFVRKNIPDLLKDDDAGKKTIDKTKLN